ncbi:MAG: pyridoxamine 5'-phosphate oxidase family protein [Proteobacteria bacterium]|nr:pyridoxamine 5'-phosphate oxidase family protein [Pseudomonadota bacterium]
MGHRFAELAFTPGVRAIQDRAGSRAHYARLEGGPETHGLLGDEERAFLAARDSLYMASVSETGWPYVQHRGGPLGFLKVLDERTIGFADFRGNRQYVSAGNLSHDPRVALILVDYPARRRLKLLGRARLVERADGATLARLATPGYLAAVERGFLIDVEAYDWNCPQHLTPRYTAAEVEQAVLPLRERIRELEAALRAQGASP